MKSKLLNLLVLIVGGLIIFNLSQNISRLWQKRGQVGEGKQRLEELKIENRKLKGELEYVQSPEFIEKEVREKLGWAKEGEEVWVLPESIREIREIGEIREEKPNWKKWLELFYPNFSE